MEKIQVTKENLKAVGTKVVVQMIKEDNMTTSGLYKTRGDTVQFEMWVKVISVGEQVKEIKPGDYCLYKASGGTFIMLDDVPYSIMESFQIDCIITEEIAQRLKETTAKAELIKTLSIK